MSSLPEHVNRTPAIRPRSLAVMVPPFIGERVGMLPIRHVEDAAITVLAVLGGPLVWREYETRREALAARAQVLLALQIASRELNTAQRKVVRPVAPASTPSSADASEKEGRP